MSLERIFETKKDTENERWLEASVDECGGARGGGITVQIHKLENFNLPTELKKRTGSFIEMAGPTKYGYGFYDFQIGQGPKPLDLAKEVPRDRFYTSNIFKGLPQWSGSAGEFKGFIDTVAFRADARALPIKTGSIDGVFCSCLASVSPRGAEDIRQQTPSEAVSADVAAGGREDVKILRRRAIEEVWRALKRGGLLIWQGGLKSDLEFGKQIGFSVPHYEEQVFHDGQKTYKIVFLKKV